MEEYKYKEEYDDMVKEYNNFKKIYEILKISAKEIQKSFYNLFELLLVLVVFHLPHKM